MWTNKLQLKKFKPSKAIVYAWYRNEECLYIGMSTQGLSRPLSDRHHVMKSELIQPNDELRWICVDSILVADAIEARLIHNLNPRYNKIRYKGQRRDYRAETFLPKKHNLTAEELLLQMQLHTANNQFLNAKDQS